MGRLSERREKTVRRLWEACKKIARRQRKDCCLSTPYKSLVATGKLHPTATVTLVDRIDEAASSAGSAAVRIGRHRNCHSRYPRLYPTRYGKAQPLESASGSGSCRRVACKLEPQLNSWSGYIRDIQDDSRIDKCSQKIRRTRSIAVIALGVCTESRREPKSARERWREPAKEREREYATNWCTNCINSYIVAGR